MLVIGNQVIAAMVAGFDKQNAGAEGCIGHGAILAADGRDGLCSRLPLASYWSVI